MRAPSTSTVRADIYARAHLYGRWRGSEEAYSCGREKDRPPSGQEGQTELAIFLDPFVKPEAMLPYMIEGTAAAAAPSLASAPFNFADLSPWMTALINRPAKATAANPIRYLDVFPPPNSTL